MIVGGTPNGTATGTVSATGKDTGADDRYLAADGKPVAVGDRFHLPDQPAMTFIVFAIDSLFVYLRPDGCVTWPRTPKWWAFARKGWVRV